MYALGHLVFPSGVSVGDNAHLQRQGAPRIDEIKGVLVTTPMPIERHFGEVGVLISPRQIREKVH